MATKNALNSPDLTQYQVVCGGTSSSYLQTTGGVGTTGQMLLSNGAGAVPTFQAQPGGALTLISHQTASNSASITFNNLSVASLYNNYVLIFRNVSVSSGVTNLTMQMSNDNGSTWITSGYKSGTNSFTYNSTSLSNTSTTNAFLLHPGFNTVSGGNIGNGRFLIQTIAADLPYISGYLSGVNTLSTTVIGGFGSGVGGSTGANAFKILMSANNIQTGDFYIYGLSGV